MECLFSIHCCDFFLWHDLVLGCGKKLDDMFCFVLLEKEPNCYWLPFMCLYISPPLGRVCQWMNLSSYFPNFR